MFTPLEVAGILAISRSKAHALIASGELGSVRIGRSRRVPVRLLHAYVDDLIGQRPGTTT